MRFKSPDIIMLMRWKVETYYPTPNLPISEMWSARMLFNTPLLEDRYNTLSSLSNTTKDPLDDLNGRDQSI